MRRLAGFSSGFWYFRGELEDTFWNSYSEDTHLLWDTIGFSASIGDT